MGIRIKHIQLTLLVAEDGKFGSTVELTQSNRLPIICIRSFSYKMSTNQICNMNVIIEEC